MSAVAKRYARALFSLAVEDETPGFEGVGEELRTLAAAFRDGGFAAALGGGALDPKSRAAVLERVLAGGRVSAVLANFVRVLGDNDRLDEIEAVSNEYRRLVDRRLGRVRAKIVSARTLDDADAQAVARAFEANVGATVLAEVDVDPELLGGIVVEIQGKVYDGSVRRQLERMKAELSGES